MLETRWREELGNYKLDWLLIRWQTVSSATIIKRTSKVNCQSGFEKKWVISDSKTSLSTTITKSDVKYKYMINDIDLKSLIYRNIEIISVEWRKSCLLEENIWIEKQNCVFGFLYKCCTAIWTDTHFISLEVSICCIALKCSATCSSVSKTWLLSMILRKSLERFLASNSDLTNCQVAMIFSWAYPIHNLSYWFLCFYKLI